MRYAGVSSFGIGGTNCHMIVASLPDALNARLPNTDSGRKSTALLLSAASDSALRRLATDYAGALREMRMPALWPSQPCTRAVSISPSAWRRH